MSSTQLLITVMVVSLGTMLTRFLPFALFPEGKTPPKIIIKLGKLLPYSVMGLLIVYCLRDAYPGTFYAVPELIAIAVVTALQLWRKNMLLSVSVGTVFYMILVQFVF
ncbi:MAG: branched-chain amino acid transporter AzlD [Ruminococcaceae bacterium]|nr:branched-chain amino acid transporter AzlD [Oscillospiraceae bacterium]